MRCGTIRYNEVALVRKIKTSIALDEDLLKWIDTQIKTRRFANRTHAIEYALEQLRTSGNISGRTETRSS
jgi:Arc/MetJ-type ribon-helix-helix transcriptional regulator